MQNVESNKTRPRAPTPVKKRKTRSLDSVKARSGWLFVLPFVLGFVIIYAPLVFESLRFSFSRLIPMTGGGFTLEFVGLENYRTALFGDTVFIEVLIESITTLIFDLPSIIIFSLFIAILLNQKMVGRAAFRAIFFIPVILATGIIDRIDQGNAMLQMMSGDGIDIGLDGSTVIEGEEVAVEGLITMADLNWLFRNMVVGQGLVEYVVAAVNSILSIVNRSGVQMLIFLAGLQSISPSIYESAYMEGASAWETFWKITFPMVSPMILVNAIYTVIDSFTSRSNSAMNFIQNVYDTATGGNVLSAAMSWIYFTLVMLLIAIVAGILSAYVFYQRRD